MARTGELPDSRAVRSARRRPSPRRPVRSGRRSPCTASVGTVSFGNSAPEPVPRRVELPGQRRPVGADERQRVVSPANRGRTDRSTARRVEVERGVGVEHPGDGHQRSTRDDAGPVPVGCVDQPEQRRHRPERMSLCHKRQSGALGLRPARSACRRAPRSRLDRTEVAALARTQPVAELVDRPQVDARGVECEAVAVVEAGVLAEAVQEDDGGPRLGGRPSAGSRRGPSSVSRKGMLRLHQVTPCPRKGFAQVAAAAPSSTSCWSCMRVRIASTTAATSGRRNVSGRVTSQ